MPARLLLPMLPSLLLRSSWLTVEGGRHGAAGVPHRRGGRAALAVSVSVGLVACQLTTLAASSPDSQVLGWMQSSRAAGETARPRPTRQRPLAGFELAGASPGFSLPSKAGGSSRRSGLLLVIVQTGYVLQDITPPMFCVRLCAAGGSGSCVLPAQRQIAGRAAAHNRHRVRMPTRRSCR